MKGDKEEATDICLGNLDGGKWVGEGEERAKRWSNPRQGPSGNGFNSIKLQWQHTATWGHAEAFLWVLPSSLLYR